ncbi:PAS domain S-box protein [Haloarcula litorea]|uniref:PAS domain S-box protein n=1 Tax=Haloarcula litorea TaxID=3032579 RepID=UPI0023E7E41A|nr:PAS domain S-box protein [Halomicroarcula sp. GDY20]
MGFSGDRGRLLDCARDKVAVVAADGEITFVNDAVERILGYEPADFVGENAFEYIHPADRAETVAAFERTVAAETEQFETITYRHFTADGSWVWLESRFSNRTDDEVDGYVVSSRDITPRIEARRERDRTEGHLLQLARTVDEVLWLFDRDWTELLFINDAYEEIYGQPAGRLEAEPTAFLDTVHPDDRTDVRAAMDRLSAGDPVDIEYRVNARRDYGVWVWVQGTPVFEGGEVVRIAGFSRDITDRRRRERHLAVMERLLRHNLRNDMTTLLGNLDILRGGVGDDLAARVETIERVATDLVATADKQREIVGLLTDTDRPTTVDVVAAVDDALDDVRAAGSSASIEVDRPARATARAVPQIRHAVRELVENAVEHAPGDDPTVRVEVRALEHGVELRVRDECPPIPESEVAVLTGDREMDDVYHTTGLGLWLVYWTVDLSGGIVEFERTSDDGNTVTVLLPSES